MSGSTEQYLVARTAQCAVAIPLAHTTEIMRPLPIAALAGAPAFVLGVTTIRGTAVPVVSAGALLGAEANGQVGRFVCVRVEGRLVALAFERVEGIRKFEAAFFKNLPPLLKSENTELVERVGALDAQLLFVLKTGRVVPDDVWKRMAALEVNGATA